MSKVRGLAASTVAALAVSLLAPTAGATPDEQGSSVETLPRGVKAAKAAGGDVIAGTLQRVAGEHGDADSWYVETNSGEIIDVVGGDRLTPGVQIRATLGNKTASGSYRLNDVQSDVSGIAPGPSAHQSYVVKATFADAGWPAGTTDSSLVDGVVRGQNYWIRESAGKITSWPTPVIGTTFKPYSVPATYTKLSSGCGLKQFSNFSTSVATAVYPGVDFSGSAPNQLVILVPPACAGGPTGIANLNNSFSSGGRLAVMMDNSADVTMAHEFGHNFGLEHANLPTQEYGDVFSVMGFSVPGTVPILGTVTRNEQGITPAAERTPASLNGANQTIVARSAATGVRSLTFAHPSNGQACFIDYRNGQGNDAGAFYTSPTGANNGYRPGVVIECDNGAKSTLYPAASGQKSLLANDYLTLNGLTVRVISTDGTSAVVQTTYGAPSQKLTGGSVSISGKVQSYWTVDAAVTGFSALPDGVAYQWSFNGTPIDGATDKSFTIPLEYAGGTLSVSATGYRAGYAPSAPVVGSFTVKGADFYSGTPRYPAIAGTPTVGQTLTATPTQWLDGYDAVPAGFVNTWQWLRDGAPIPGATAQSYTLTAADGGHAIQIMNVPSAPYFNSEAWSKSSSVWVPALPAVTVPPPPAALNFVWVARPTIKGQARVGKKVKAVPGRWDPGVTFTYRWLANGKAVKKGTTSSLKITRKLRRKVLVVQVTGSKPGYLSRTISSKPKRVR